MKRAHLRKHVQRLFASSRNRGRSHRQQLVGRLPPSRKPRPRACRVDSRPHNLRHPSDRLRRLDGGPAELHHDHRQQPLHLHQLRIQHRRARGSANRVVAQRDELVIQHGTLPQPADKHRHPVLALHIAARLRTILLLHINHRAAPARSAVSSVRNASKAIQRRDDLRFGRLLLKLHRHANRMPVHHRHAIAGGAHLRVQWLDLRRPRTCPRSSASPTPSSAPRLR